MQTFKRVIVGLDFTETDDKVVSYTSFFSKILKFKKIYFVHVHNHLDIPEEVRQEIYGTDTPLDEILEDEMKRNVKAHFENYKDFNIEYKVLDGPTFSQILNFSKIKEANLVILGRKETAGSGMLLTRMSRRARASILIVPENAQLYLDSISVCMDFSKNSEVALEYAIDISKAADYTNVYCHHVYTVPTGYHASGKSLPEFAQIMKKQAASKFDEFIANVDEKGVRVAPVYTFDKKHGSAKLVTDAAASMQSELILVGSKGRTYAASIFLGSFAEKLIRQKSNIPLLVIKRKGETLGIIDAIKNM